MTDTSSPDPLTTDQRARAIALETARATLATGHPMGARVLPEHRTTTDVTDLANYILDGTDPATSQATRERWAHPSLGDVQSESVEGTANDDTEAALAMYRVAETILQTGGAVEVHGVRITPAYQDGTEPAREFLADVLAERHRQQDALGYGIAHDAQHAPTTWANMVTDRLADALASIRQGDDPRADLVKAAALITAWADATEHKKARGVVHARRFRETWCNIPISDGLPPEDDELTSAWADTTCPACQQAAPGCVRNANGWDA